MKPFKLSVGRRPLVVHIGERKGRRNLWLWWWSPTANNYVWEPTTLHLRDEDGRYLVAVESQAADLAEAKRKELSGSVSPVLSGDHLTLRGGLALAIDPERGLYPVATPHRKELERAITFAADVLKNKAWVAIGPQDIKQVWRAKIRELIRKGHPGHRQAEVVTIRLLTVAHWLEGNSLIPGGSCKPPHEWREALKSDWRQITGTSRDPIPNRPRHTVAQVQAVLRVAKDVDPRFHLLLWLGLELRLGQVARARRSDLDLDAGTFQVHGLGHKKGTTVALTAGQVAAARDALAGYLAPLEQAGGDYPLFPSGQLKGGRSGKPTTEERHRNAPPIGATGRRKWFIEAERLAGVPRIPGRGYYGFRRGATDEAAKVDGLDEEALKRFGGWTDSQMPRQVYKDQQDAAADRRASVVRSRIRGEPVATTIATKTEGSDDVSVIATAGRD